MPVTSASSLRFAPWLILALVALGGCFRQVSDESALPARPRYTGTAPWTIDGVRPGDTFDDLKARLGEPRDVREYSGIRTATWNYGQLTVTFDRSGRATEVTGQSIQAATETLVTVGAPEAEVEQVLGEGQTRKGYTPGSGVISLWGKHTSTTHYYDNTGVRFEVAVMLPEGTVANLWARPPPPESR